MSPAPTCSGIPAAAPHELRRERLLQLLHLQNGRQLIVLLAPAGSGKSILAAAYAREISAVVGWLRLEAGDRDSRALFGRLSAALEASFVPLHALRAGLAAGAEGVRLARLLLKDLVQTPAGFVVVLDDFHIVQDTDDVVEAIDTLVCELPEVGQLVLTSREPPPLSMTRLVARNAVFGVGADVLRFTEEESRELANCLGRVDAGYIGELQARAAVTAYPARAAPPCCWPNRSGGVV
ncbi:MAG: hypothetical protein M3069_19405 [Chloroflexota bacterium]|nr:hypothetical protein [Chloroflexota bacterium]